MSADSEPELEPEPEPEQESAPKHFAISRDQMPQKGYRLDRSLVWDR